MLQTIELVDELKKKFGYSDISFAQQPATSTASTTSTNDTSQEVKPVVPEKTSFSVRLEGYDVPQKVKVIKEVRAIADLGLKEAKELVESAPKIIKKDLTKEEAQKLVDILQSCGGKCVIE